MSNTPSSLEDRALKLLGSGIPAEDCARTLGVDASRIAQLLSSDSFAERLSALRYSSLQKHNERDEEIDGLEDTLIRQFKQVVPMLMEPMKIVNALKIVNGMRRRGASSPDAILSKQSTVRLNVAVAVMQKFSTNSAQQIVTVNGESMVTLQSGQMTKLLEERKDELQQQIAQPVFESGEVKIDRYGFARREQTTDSRRDTEQREFAHASAARTTEE
jgi:hypothetical protein